MFGSALASLAVTRSSAVLIRDEDYINRKLGIAFRKPDGWVFSDVLKMGEIAKGQLLKLNDPELLEEFAPDRSLPVLTISRELLSAQATRFTPGINIFLTRLSSELKQSGFELQAPFESVTDDIESNQLLLSEFEITTHPKSCLLSECDAADYTATFLFEHANLARPVPVRMRTVCIHQDPAFYTIRMYDAPKNRSADTVDYEQFLQNVRMV